jgi:hypothetical protein
LKRYLWADSFAVCNFLEIFRQTGNEKYNDLAIRLIEQVHWELGRHREDDPRTGWISGLDEVKGKRHPTIGGLRIGKEFNERGPNDPLDEHIEWSRNGQYYHYLTKWMHALNIMSRTSGDKVYNTWAVELAKKAHDSFVYMPSLGEKKKMYWKMSIDLSRPLVPAMGQHDALDGLITYYQLQDTGDVNPEVSGKLELKSEIADMSAICEGKRWYTDDPLGLGSLLCDSLRLAQLIVHKNFDLNELLEILLEDSLKGLKAYIDQNQLKIPAGYRLAFRELGLSIGLKAIEILQNLIAKHPDFFPNKKSLDLLISHIMQESLMSEVIDLFWLDSGNREADSWTEHRYINMVMLATSLKPEGFLLLNRDPTHP